VRIGAVAVSLDGKFVVALGALGNGNVAVWETATGREVQRGSLKDRS
jgi:hypothetical protein